MGMAYSGLGMTFPDGTFQGTAGFTGFRNRIMNGDMRLDSRNNGVALSASVAGTKTYTIDRWAYTATQASKFSVQQNYAAITPPVGFSNYLGVVTTSAYTPLTSDYFILSQDIEGFSIADLGFGSTSAQQITLSFWVQSSLVGTFGGALRNSTQTRSYPFNYTIATANTWTKVTLNIPGDTIGTWLTNNGIGLTLDLGLGVGATYGSTSTAWQAGNFMSYTGAVSVVATNGATFYVTGVQIEKGQVSTPTFEYRPLSVEDALCKRYAYVVNSAAVSGASLGAGLAISTTQATVPINFPVAMRATPAAPVYSAATDFNVANGSGTNVTGSATGYANASPIGVELQITVASGLTAGQATILRTATTAARVVISAEL